MKKIVVITDTLSPRLTYICKIIFGDYLGIKYRLSMVNQLEENEIPIHYSKISHPNAINIPPVGFLSKMTIHHVDIVTDSYKGLPTFFLEKDSSDYDLPFDIFSCCFFLLSRYEEYLETPKDQHDRYQSKYSLAVRDGFVHLPLVDMWIERLAEIINQAHNTSYGLSGSFRKEVTIDIDLPYAYKYKGWKVTVGIIRDIVRFDIGGLRARIRYWATGVDPFDTYDLIKTICGQSDFKPIFFILNKYQKPLDENHLANKDQLAVIIKKLSAWAHVGIHPSISAGNDEMSVQDETKYVSQHLSYQIIKSRQHFLKFSIPDTFHNLIRCGITDDYSMGYHDVMGFRASTARPFQLYDLVNERPLNIVVHPCMTMDVTMRLYRNLSPQDAIQSTLNLIKTTEEVKGTFSFIWHNSSLSNAYGWQGWAAVFKSLVRRRPNDI